MWLKMLRTVKYKHTHKLIYQYENDTTIEKNTLRSSQNSDEWQSNQWHREPYKNNHYHWIGYKIKQLLYIQCHVNTIQPLLWLLIAVHVADR